MRSARSLWVVLLLVLPVAASSAARYAHVPMDPAWCREVGSGELVATVDTVLLWYNGEKVYGPLSFYIADNDSVLYMDGTVRRARGDTLIRMPLVEYEPPWTEAETEEFLSRLRENPNWPRIAERQALHDRAKAAADSILQSGGSCTEATQAALRVYRASDLILSIPMIGDSGLVVVMKSTPNARSHQPYCHSNRGMFTKHTPREVLMGAMKEWRGSLRRGFLILLGFDGERRRLRYDLTIPRREVEEVERTAHEFIDKGCNDPELERMLRDGSMAGNRFVDDLKRMHGR